MESDISGRKIKMWIQIVLIIVLCMIIAYSVYQKRQTYRKIDRLLDCVLSQEEIVYSDVEEGEFRRW